MDLTPIYELRTRLRAAAMAGTGLVTEDYRLKRAVEAFGPLEAASPVFARIGLLGRTLLEPDCQDRAGVLLDAITLTDAVLCTQGAVAVSGTIEELEHVEYGLPVTNIPYSVLHTLLDALQNSGSGRYSYVLEMHEKQPELFEDYRVRAAMVQALGASYAELAEQAADWLKQGDTSVVPLLKEGFDPNGKKEMVRRVRVLESICKEKENDFYLAHIPQSEKAVREALIFALRHCQENVTALIDLTRTEKGNCKKMAFWAMAYMDSPAAEDFWKQYGKKKPMEALNYLSVSGAAWAGELMAEGLVELLEPWTGDGCGKRQQVLTEEMAGKIYLYIKALPGKTGKTVCQCFRTAAAVEQRLNHPVEGKKKVWKKGGYPGRQYEEECGFEEMVAETLHQAILRCPDKDLGMLATELYETYGNLYFSAALTAKLLEEPGTDCREWLENQIWNKNLWGKKIRKEMKGYLADALSYVVWDKKEQCYILKVSGYNPANEQKWEHHTKIAHAMDEDFTELLMECSDTRLDGVMSRWIRSTDSSHCRRMEEYYYKKALVVKDNRRYLEFLRRCNAQECEGLAVHYFKGKTQVRLWEIDQYFKSMPGSIQAKREEAERVCEMLANGKTGLFHIKPEDTGTFAEAWIKGWSES